VGTQNRLLGGDDSGKATLPPDVSAGTMLLAVADANLRAQPASDANILRVIPVGAVVKLLDANQQSGYLHINHDGMEGYAFAASFTVYVPPAPPPTVSGDDAIDDPQLPADVDWKPGTFAPGSPTPAGSSGPVPGPSPTPQPDPAPGPDPIPDPTPTPDPGPIQQGPTPRDNAIARAESGLGYSYWWGGAAWIPNGLTSSNAGVCFFNADGSHNHTGQYGADCSGYVSKIWQVPDDNTDLTYNTHPFSTYSFNFTYAHWSDVDRSALQRADAMVYNNGTNGHIFLFDSGDPWGSAVVYEASGCVVPISHHLRTVSSAYKGIVRDGY
jgi:hypothetical protein